MSYPPSDAAQQVIDAFHREVARFEQAPWATLFAGVLNRSLVDMFPDKSDEERLGYLTQFINSCNPVSPEFVPALIYVEAVRSLASLFSDLPRDTFMTLVLSDSNRDLIYKSLSSACRDACMLHPSFPSVQLTLYVGNRKMMIGRVLMENSTQNRDDLADLLRGDIERMIGRLQKAVEKDGWWRPLQPVEAHND